MLDYFRKGRPGLRWTALAVLLAAGFSALPAQDKLLDVLAAELQREMDALKKQETAPYYLAYRVDEVRRVIVSSSFGALTQSDETVNRYLTVMVRVGEPKLDNTHSLRGDMMEGLLSRVPVRVALPLDDDADAIRAILWKETDSRYKAAVDRLAKVKANVAVKVEQEDKSADFTLTGSPAVHFEPPVAAVSVDRDAWAARVKAYSACFKENPKVAEGDAGFSYTTTRKYFVSSEGVRVVQNTAGAYIRINGSTKSDDGMELPLYRTFFAYTPEGLPGDAEVLAEVKALVKKLEALRTAPVVDPYSGPALLSGKASGVFFHEIFGHRIEGHRQKSEDEGQTFKKKVGEKLLPESLTVLCDPLRKQFAGQDLCGYYLFDDEGTKAERVTIVDRGVLRDFLMSRSPIEGFPRSNGHGRSEAGYAPVARQSNLIIETEGKLSMDDLRKRLVEECRKQGKPFGLLFQEVTGGFTMTGRYMPNAFNVTPVEVYRIYADGKPDELVRGVDLVGTPLVIFSNVEAAGGDTGVFTGTCGAESGGVPVTCVSPTLLIRQIEVQKKDKSQEKPPLLPRPCVEGIDGTAVSAVTTR
ncbi:MAG: TldD/PmbA family protein [Acidobacteria bacterium]|nr:TldD/PmbA family protein [Acidobacteriota bacterium]